MARYCEDCGLLIVEKCMKCGKGLRGSMIRTQDRVFGEVNVAKANVYGDAGDALNAKTHPSNLHTRKVPFCRDCWKELADKLSQQPDIQTVVTLYGHDLCGRSYSEVDLFIKPESPEIARDIAEDYLGKHICLQLWNSGEDFCCSPHSGVTTLPELREYRENMRRQIRGEF